MNASESTPRAVDSRLSALASSRFQKIIMSSVTSALPVVPPWREERPRLGDEVLLEKSWWGKRENSETYLHLAISYSTVLIFLSKSSPIYPDALLFFSLFVGGRSRRPVKSAVWDTMPALSTLWSLSGSKKSTKSARSWMRIRILSASMREVEVTGR